MNYDNFLPKNRIQPTIKELQRINPHLTVLRIARGGKLCVPWLKPFPRLSIGTVLETSIKSNQEAEASLPLAFLLRVK